MSCRSSAPDFRCSERGGAITGGAESRFARMRGAIAVGAAFVLGLILAARNPPAELARRVRFVARASSLDLPRRRLAGSSAAFDRPFFVFLESVRRTLPASAAGVLIAMPAPSESALHLAAYTLAPVPVRLAPAPLAPGWLLAVYGPARPAGTRVLRELPGGALLAPASP